MPNPQKDFDAFERALKSNNIDSVERILRTTDVTAASDSGWTCLMFTCRYASSPEVMKMVLAKIVKAGDYDLLKSQLAATIASGWTCFMLSCGNSASPEVTKLLAVVLFSLDLFKQQHAKLDHGDKETLKDKTGIDSSAWTPDADSLAEAKAILQGGYPAAAKKKAAEEAAAKKKAEEEAAAKKKAEKEAASPEMPNPQKDFDAFERALKSNNIDSVERILRTTDVTAASDSGWTCLMFTCRYASSPEVMKMVLAKIVKAGDYDLLKSQLAATIASGWTCFMLSCGNSASPEVTKLLAVVLFSLDLFKQQHAKLDHGDKETLKDKTGIDSSAWTPDADSLAEAKAILQGGYPAAAKKKAAEEAAAKKKAEEEAAAKRKAEEEAAAKKKAEDEAAAKKKAEAEAAAKKKAEDEAAAKKKAEEEAAAKKKAAEEAAAKKKAAEEAAAKKKAEEEAAAKKKAEEEAVMRKTSETRSPSPVGISRVKKGELGIGFSSTPIGSGATCSVYACRYLGTEFAAKIFHSHITSDKAVQREMNAAVHLKHPNVVNVLAIIVDDTDQDSIIGLLMQRMNGTLLQRVTNIAPYEDAAAPAPLKLIKWCSQTASAILCAHSLKCIHCDIKPENVMLDSKDVAHLTDFGSAHVMSTAATKVTSVRGTALYIAPEYAALDVEEPNEKTDVFSFGMLMWVVFHPKEDHRMGKSDMQIGRSLDRGKRPEITNKDLPSEIVSLIEKCWHEEADERPEMADVLTVFNEVIAKIEENENAASSVFKLTPSLLWTDARYLKTKYGSIADHLSSLKWNSPENAPSLHFSEDITDKNSPLVKFIEAKFRPSPGCKKAEENDSDTYFSGKFSRLQMVQPADAHSLFLALHEADGSSRFANSFLRHKNNSDSATQNALEKLRSVFEDPDCNPITNKQNFSRILFGWHGTNAAIADLVCRDGPRSLRLTDAGFFGAGSYFALEADYAANYAYMSNTNSKHEYAIILFAVSVSQTYPITLLHDYRSKEDVNRPDMHGFSNFYNGPDPKKAIALAPKCDSHFIPVKKHGDGRQHPLGKYDTLNGNAVVEKDKTRVACHLDQQACDAKDPEVNGHEVLILNHQRAVPVAVMYFK